jgi:hypothetical protein
MKKSELRQIIREEYIKLCPSSKHDLEESHQPGDEVLYKGTRYIVVNEDGYIITLKNKETGKIIKLNYNQFKNQEVK